MSDVDRWIASWDQVQRDMYKEKEMDNLDQYYEYHIPTTVKTKLASSFVLSQYWILERQSSWKTIIKT